jgi:prepilin-type processing-associated H-X9-DG protein
VRHYAAVATAVLCLAACAAPAEAPPAATASSTATVGVVDPTRVDRVRAELPAGYEVADLTDRPAPVALWGFGPGWSAVPPQCGALADPVFDAASLRGWSASGGGGIVYTFAADGAAAPDPALVDGCARWTLTAGPTSGTVSRLDVPVVDGAVTLAIAADVVTTVEGGTATRSHADTTYAFVDGHVVVVAVVTDPGSVQTPLDAGFAAGLLTKTVAALRG